MTQTFGSLKKLVTPSRIANLALLMGLLSLLLTAYNSASQTSKDETTLNRVLRTRTLRCAQIIDPATSESPLKSNNINGNTTEIVEEIAKSLGLKVAWQNNIDISNYVQALNNRKIDALCSALEITPLRTESVLFTTPFAYTALFAYVRVGDERFDHSLDALDDHSLRIALLNNQPLSQTIINLYPKAIHNGFDDSRDFSSLLESIADGKSDIAIGTLVSGKSYIDRNPGKIKILTKSPVETTPLSLFAVELNDQGLANLLNTSIQSLQNSGFIEKTLRKHEGGLDSYLLVRKPYQEHDKYLW